MGIQRRRDFEPCGVLQLYRGQGSGNLPSSTRDAGPIETGENRDEGMGEGERGTFGASGV